MDSNVVRMYPNNSAENPDLVLEQAIGKFSDVLIIGYDKEGDLDVRSNLALKHKDCLWLVQTFITKLMNGDYQERE